MGNDGVKGNGKGWQIGEICVAGERERHRKILV